MTTKRHDLVPSPGFSDDDSAPASNLSSMQRAIVTIQKLRSKVESLERSRTESIAIIGMGCRYPGGANSPEAFFRLLEDGIDAVTEVPPERWTLERESADSEGEQRSLRWGAFLKDVDRFDAAFFGISPREAESLDPQQRLLLEVSWEALERAGQLPERLMGSKTGVFVGIWSLDYQQRVSAQDPDKLDAYCFTGNVLSTAAGRLAYTLGLQGPCMSVETACSSSLTAIHLACQSLRAGESSLALAGGVNLMLSPTTTKLLSKTQALSPDGRCKTFDARANGFVRGEGCGILVLKRLSDAERDGDTILATIRGSALNQDGRSTGLTAPNVLSQQALLRQALENARLAPQDIGYVETHGTGTSLGDPIEMEAIKAVLGSPRDKGASCILGAVKTNIGHLEAAAGVAGVMKVVLAMQNDKIPGNLHFRSLNPRIDLKDTALEIAQEAKPWSGGARVRFAGVSSFGISGTNAHVILEEAPRNMEEALFEDDASTCILPISAKTPEALRDHARAFHEMLISPQAPRLLDIVYTASVRRSHYLHRLSVVGNTKADMAAQLHSYLEGNGTGEVVQGQATPARAKVVFVFSGQGSQWLGMGRQLYESDSSFRSVIDTCDNLMTARLGWSILDELDSTEATSRMGETQIAQPLLFAVQVALVEMLRSWGIAPDAMIGHSVGEVAAAHIAGILSLDEAIRLVALRGRIMQKATGMGKMVSVSMTTEQARNIIAGYEDRVAIAAVNDPGSIVLSGAPQAIDDIMVRCEKQGFVSRPVRVNYAFHSPQMEPFERELVDRLVRVDTRRATLAMYSTVLADCVDGKELDVRYWGRNIRDTVDFTGAVFAAIRDGYQLFLEVGPHPVLTANIQQCLAAKKSDGLATFTMRRNQDQRQTLLEATGALYTRGCLPEWPRVVPSSGKNVPLPTYPWQRERYWIEGNSSRVFTSARFERAAKSAIHPLLGSPLNVAIKPNTAIWQQTVGTSTHRWIAEHVVQGVPVFPGAAYVEMALAAKSQALGIAPKVIEGLVFERMLALPDDHAPVVQVVLDGDGTQGELTIASRAAETAQWLVHARGHIIDSAGNREQPLDSLANVRLRCTEKLLVSEHYARLASCGLEYGGLFRGVHEIWRGTKEVLAQVKLSGNSSGEFIIHPAQLDACLQVAAALATFAKPSRPIVPVRMDQIFWRNAVKDNVWVYAKSVVDQQNADEEVTDLIIWDNDGEVIAEINGFALRYLDARPNELQDSLDKCVFRLDWRAKPPAPQSGARGSWLVISTEEQISREVVALLRERARVVHVLLDNRYEQRGNDEYVIDARSLEDYAAVFSAIFRNERHWRGVVHLGALSGTNWQNTTPQTLRSDQSIGSISVLYTSQAIIRQGLRDVPRLWVVTRNAQTVNDQDGPGCIGQSTIWGMARTITLEHPEFNCSRIDLDEAYALDTIAAILVRELNANDSEDQIALRCAGRFVARLARTQLPRETSNALPVRENATYMITGGLGGLGLALAEWLVHRGARYLALVGRRGADDVARAKIRAMEELGAKVAVFEADMSQQVDVSGVLERLDREWPPLRGIVHAAAVLADHTLLELSGNDFEHVLGAKLIGAFLLHKASADRALDFFIIYSSAAALLGSQGQANYAAANAGVDALVRARRAMGLPASSIQWGPFAKVGLAAAQNNRGMRLAERGLESLSVEEGFEAMSRVSPATPPEVGILRFDVRRWLESQPQAAGSAFWDELRQEQAATKTTSKGSQLRRTLEELGDEQRRGAVEQHVRGLLAKVLHIDVNRVDLDAPLTTLGLDSLTSLELRNRLETTLEFKLPATFLFSYPTSRAVIAYLSDKLVPRVAAEPVEMVPPTQKVPAENSADLSADDDLLAEFDASMTSIKDQGFA